jgi:hypothetical protein
MPHESIKAEELLVEWSDGRVTLDARDSSLRQVLDSMALHGALLVVSGDPLDERMSLSFETLEMHTALKRIMRSRSYLLVELPATPGSGPAGAARRSTLRILSDDDPMAGHHSRRSEGDLEFLQYQLMGDDLRAKKDAIKALGKHAAESAIPPLAFALSDENKSIRFKAVQALAQFETTDAVAALATAAADEHPGIRAEAAYWLGEIGGESTLPVLQLAQQDTDSDVREAAEDALRGR